jgi:hypothetical protein
MPMRGWLESAGFRAGIASSGKVDRNMHDVARL